MGSPGRLCGVYWWLPYNVCGRDGEMYFAIHRTTEDGDVNSVIDRLQWYFDGHVLGLEGNESLHNH